MGSQRGQLVEDYAKHFARLNETLDTGRMTDTDFRSLSRTFGGPMQRLRPGDRVLDLGCGTGFLLNWIRQQPGVIAIGVDGSPTQLEIARRNLPDVEFNCADGLEYLRQHEESFDGIFCTDVLEHVPGTDSCIEWVQAARAALRPGGFFVCRGPNAANLCGNYSRYIDLTHERSFTEKSILQLLEAGGLEDFRVLPIYAGTFTGRFRQLVEKWLHRLAFRICGHGGLTEFSNNVCAVGFRRD
jgi:2-polyprenyl-3-methyl-5-hydroxy-6-metoxy-1,4-benzoquinol methylase